jgi:hypothetical protein
VSGNRSRFHKSARIHKLAGYALLEAKFSITTSVLFEELCVPELTVCVSDVTFVAPVTGAGPVPLLIETMIAELLRPVTVKAATAPWCVLNNE